MYSLILSMAVAGVGQGPGPLAAQGCHGRVALYPPVARRDPVIEWNQAALEAIRAERTPPPLAARNLAMVHVAVYDAVNCVHGGHERYLVDWRAPAGTSADAAAAVAAHRTLSALFPRQVGRFDLLLDRSLGDVPASAGRDEGIRLGQAVAERVLAWRSQDGSARTVSYRPRPGMDYWLPTPPEFQPPLAPHWGQVQPFAMHRPADFRPGPPPPCTSRAFARSFDEVKHLGGQTNHTRTPEQTEIARFWEAGPGTVTPPGHWNRIAQAVSDSRGLSLVENARLFALLNLALADAGILAWDCKYHYDYVRPVTAIRRGDHDGNPDTWSDPSWTPLLPTPAFPAYTSGHSSFSAAAAAVLAEFLGGDQVRFTSESDSLPGVRRSFASFSAAAAEAGRSRIYGGIHWDFDDQEGQKSGARLGQFVARHFLKPQARDQAAAPRDQRHGSSYR